MAVSPSEVESYYLFIVVHRHENPTHQVAVSLSLTKQTAKVFVYDKLKYHTEKFVQIPLKELEMVLNCLPSTNDSTFSFKELKTALEEISSSSSSNVVRLKELIMKEKEPLVAILRLRVMLDFVKLSTNFSIDRYTNCDEFPNVKGWFGYRMRDFLEQYYGQVVLCAGSQTVESLWEIKNRTFELQLCEGKTCVILVGDNIQQALDWLDCTEFSNWSEPQQLRTIFYDEDWTIRENMVTGFRGPECPSELMISSGSDGENFQERSICLSKKMREKLAGEVRRVLELEKVCKFMLYRYRDVLDCLE